MPVTHSFESPSTFVVSASGAVTFAEVTEMLGRMVVDPNLRSAKVILADGREATAAPNSSELRELAAELKRMTVYGVDSVAIVTASLAMYGMARMFAVFADLIDLNVVAFRDMDAARAWLAAGGREPE